MFPEAWGKVQATTAIKKLVEQRNDVCLAPMWVSIKTSDSWLLQRHDDDDISTMPPSRGSQAGLSIAKVLRICQKGEIHVNFSPCAEVLPMLCQASIRSRLSKGYLDHDICRWKTGKQFNATGMCTVHSAAYVHIQMLDVSLSLLPSRIGSSWVSDILRHFLLFDSPISPKPKGLRHPNVAWFLKPPVKNVVGVLETGAVHGLIVSKKCHISIVQDGGLPYCDKRFKKQPSAQEQ